MDSFGLEGFFAAAPRPPLEPAPEQRRPAPAVEVAPAGAAPILPPAPAPAPVPLAAPAAVPLSGSPQLGAPATGRLGAPAPGRLGAPVPTPPQAAPSGIGRPGVVDAAAQSLPLADLLAETLDSGSSDLHLTVGSRPVIRRHGSLTVLDDRPELTAPMVQTMLYSVLTQRQRELFEANLELDFAYGLPGRARFRVNLYRQRDSLGAAFRVIPTEVTPLEELGLPSSVADFAGLPRGFVLVTGPTGSGKSTTLASLVDLANRTRRDHILTVEDPIEFLHRHKSCLVNQREVGQDTHSFASALKHALRQDPDIIMVGEMRDLETISVALTAAETGHLVFATLHTQDAAQSIDRVIDVFPPEQQAQVRVQLSGALQGIVSQQLCRTAEGRGRVLAAEVLVATPAIRNLIREGKTHQIYTALQAGAGHGMSTMDQHLAALVRTNRISYETGLEKCHHQSEFDRMLGGR